MTIQIGSKKRGRPSLLTDEDIDRVLRYVVRYGNGPAVRYSRLSRSTVERIKSRYGFTGKRIYRPVVRDVAEIGILATSKKYRLSVELVEDILKATGHWIADPERNVEDLLR